MLFAVVVIAVGCAPVVLTQSVVAKAWRIANGDRAYLWRVRSLQFFSDIQCEHIVDVFPGQNGKVIATDSEEMTGAEFLFDYGSLRGWASAAPCDTDECRIGYEWHEDVVVQCVKLVQGEEGLHADALALQWRDGDVWRDLVRWSSVSAGKAQLALLCPAVPSVDRAVLVGTCKEHGPRSQDCVMQCIPGFGAVNPAMRCINGVWFKPQCLPEGSRMRVVAQAPETIKPYWVVLNAEIFEDTECVKPISMAGGPFSSGEFKVKYANYHPKNIWDHSADTSWASQGPCSPGSCHFGFQFQNGATPFRCIKITHPDHIHEATQVSVEVLGSSGWEEAADVVVQLFPLPKDEL